MYRHHLFDLTVDFNHGLTNKLNREFSNHAKQLQYCFFVKIAIILQLSYGNKLYRWCY